MTPAINEYNIIIDNGRLYDSKYRFSELISVLNVAITTATIISNIVNNRKNNLPIFIF